MMQQAPGFRLAPNCGIAYQSAVHSQTLPIMS